MFAHLSPHSSNFGDICALYSPFFHQLTVQSSLFEPGCLRPCPSYSRRRDCINLGLLRSLYKGGRVLRWGVRDPLFFGAAFAWRNARMRRRNQRRPLGHSRSSQAGGERGDLLMIPSKQSAAPRNTSQYAQTVQGLRSADEYHGSVGPPICGNAGPMQRRGGGGEMEARNFPQFPPISFCSPPSRARGCSVCPLCRSVAP